MANSLSYEELKKEVLTVFRETGTKQGEALLWQVFLLKGFGYGDKRDYLEPTLRKMQREGLIKIDDKGKVRMIRLEIDLD